MKLNRKQFVAVALAGACIASTGSYAASAQDATVDPAVDPEVVAESLSGELATPPPVQIAVDPAPVVIEEPAVSSPEEENLTNVTVRDPGPVMPADPGAVDSAVVGSVGAAPDATSLAAVSTNVADNAGGGECSATASVPYKQDIKIWGNGSVSCGSVQRSLNVIVCLEVRQAGAWDELGCKPKTVSQAKSTSKKVSVACVPGRFLYRTVVWGAATSRSGNRSSIPQDTAVTSGRIPCAS